MRLSIMRRQTFGSHTGENYSRQVKRAGITQTMCM